MEIKHVIAFVSLVLFIGYFFFSKSPRRSYVLFLLIFFPFIDLNITPEEYGSISVFDFISYFALVFTLEDFFSYSRGKNIYNVIISALIGLLFIGSLKSEFIGNSLINFFKFLSVFIFSKMLIDECMKDLSFTKLVIKSLKLGCIISLVFLLIQIIIGIKFTLYPDLNPNVYMGLGSDTLRFPSFFQDPQKYAQYLSMLGFIFLMNRETKATPGILNMAIFVLVVLAVLLTGSRAGFLGLLMGLLIAVLFKKGKIWIIAFCCILVGYLIVTNFPQYFSILNRGEDFNTSFGTRYEIWKEGVQIFSANPLLGIGIGNHHNYIVSHSISGYYLIDDNIVYYGTESGYVQILIECGLLGFILIFFLILKPVIDAFRSYKYFHNFNIILLIGSIISWMTAYATLNSLSDKRILVILITLVCLLVVAKKSPEAIYG